MIWLIFMVNGKLINHTYMDPMGYAKYPKTPNSSGSYAHHVLQISYVYFFGFEGICPPLSLCMYTAGYDAPEVGCHRASQLPPRWLPRGSSWRPTKALGVRNIVMVADPRLEAKKQRRHPESISAAVCLCGFVFPEIWFDEIQWNSSLFYKSIYKEYVWWSFLPTTEH